MTTKLEYRVKPITRYVVTRYESGENTGGVSERGTFDNADVAYEVAYAMCKLEHEKLGYKIDDERVQYPEHPRAQSAIQMTASNLPGATDSNEDIAKRRIEAMRRNSSAADFITEQTLADIKNAFETAGFTVEVVRGKNGLPSVRWNADVPIKPKGTRLPDDGMARAGY